MVILLPKLLNIHFANDVTHVLHLHCQFHLGLDAESLSNKISHEPFDQLKK